MERLNRRAIIIVGLIMILAISLWGIGFFGQNIITYAGDLEVDITLQTSYELVYNGSDFLTEDNDILHPNNELFGVLEFTEKLTGDPANLIPNDIIITGQASVIDAGTYTIVFTIDSNNALYYGDLSTSITITPKELLVALPSTPSVFYGQTLNDISLIYVGFVGGESAQTLITDGKLTQPTINNINSVALSPLNNGSIVIALDSDGTADNYTLVSDTLEVLLTIKKARVEVTFSSNALPYIYNNYISNNTPSANVYNLMVFENSDIGMPISAGISISDITISNHENLVNAGTYDLAINIDASNDFYTISPTQTSLAIIIEKAELSIDAVDVDSFFLINATKVYDGTQNLSTISIIQSDIMGENGEELVINAVNAKYDTKEVGTNKAYFITFTTSSDNYYANPISVPGTYGGAITQYEILTFSPQNFIGLNPHKEYDTEYYMTTYDLVVFVPHNFTQVLTHISERMETIYGLTFAQSQQFVFNLTICQTSEQGQTDEYIVIRLNYFDALNALYTFLSDPHLAAKALDGFILNVGDWLSAEEYSFDLYQNDEIADIYFTELKEVILLENVGTHIYGEYYEKNAIVNEDNEPVAIEYDIQYDGFTNNNYSFSSTFVTGNDGYIDKAIVGVVFPTLTKYYGDDNPLTYRTPFVTKNDIEMVSGETCEENENMIILPFAVRSYYGGGVYSYFNKVLTGFYESDLSNPEIMGILDSGELLMSFMLAISGIDLDVYDSVDAIGVKATRYGLIADMISNYNFLGVLKFIEEFFEPDEQMYFTLPGIVVEPKSLDAEQISIDFSKVYDGTSDIIFTVDSDGYAMIEGDEEPYSENKYLYLSLTAKYFNDILEENSIVNDNLLVSNFEMTLKYSEAGELYYNEDELLIKIHNYDINKKSVGLLLNDITTVTLNIKIVNEQEEEVWVDYDTYELSYSTNEILDFRMEGILEETISIIKTELTIGVEEGQEFTYGNDILKNLVFHYENFYQTNPEQIFDISYQLYDAFSTMISNTANDEATQLVPSVLDYYIEITNVIYDTDWLFEYGNNYSIIFSSSMFAFKINKKELAYTIKPAQKKFGDLDPIFEFETIEGYRDSDLVTLQSKLKRTMATQSGQEYESAGAVVEIELDSHNWYTYLSEFGEYPKSRLIIKKREVLITPEQFEIPYGQTDSSGWFDVSIDYETEVLPLYASSIILSLEYTCFARNLNASSSYDQDVIEVKFKNMSDININNFNFILTNGQNKIRIIPINQVFTINDYVYEISKVYDGLPLQITVERSDSNLPTLKYNDLIHNAVIYGYEYDSTNDLYTLNPNVGSKVFRFESITILDSDIDKSTNYNFTINTTTETGTITKRQIDINNDMIYKKTYDGMVMSVPFNANMAMSSTGKGLIANHAFDNSSLWFETVGSSVSLDTQPLELRQAPGGFKILFEEVDVSANYELNEQNYGQGEIVYRKIVATISSTIIHTYDGQRVVIDLATGALSTKKGLVYSDILDELGQQIIKEINYAYSSNHNENTLETVFVEGHSIAGKLITANSNADTFFMGIDEEIKIGNNAESNYSIEYANNFKTTINKREITIDVNESEGTEIYPERYPTMVYNGTVFSIELTLDMAVNLVNGHTITGERRTFDSNVSISGGQILPKTLTESLNVGIKDALNEVVTNNYNITYIERKAIIEKRVLSIDINEDSNLTTTKIYDGQLFVVDVTLSMALNVVLGETIGQGEFCTLDSNAYNIDENNEIVFEPKVLSITNAILINKQNSLGQIEDSTDNYDIIVVNNFVTITPKNVKVDMNNVYRELSFVYKGSIYEFDITANMITEMVGEESGLIYGHSILGTSQKMKSESEYVAEGIDIVFPEGELYIEDAYITNNYIFNYVPIQIDIIKRQLEISVNFNESILTKVYDTEVFEIDLDADMDIDINDNNRGLVEGHFISGKAKTLDGFTGNYKTLIPEFYSIYDAENNMYIDNYNITFINTTAAITPRQLYVDVNANMPEGHQKVYDASSLIVYLTNDMITGLQGDDVLIVSGEDKSYRKTTNINSGTFSLDSEGEGPIMIKRYDFEENLAYNYTFNYIDSGTVQILKRKIYITVRNESNYGIDSEGDFVSGLRNEYYDDKYTIDYNFYKIDNANNDNDGFGFELVDGHKFNAGSRITESKNAKSKMLLLENQNIAIINSSTFAIVTSNYEVEYQDVYFEIYKRKICFDVARNAQGNVNAYENNGSFIKKYDRHLYEIELKVHMITSEEGDSDIVNGHIVSKGYLQSANENVERNENGDVIPKHLVWGAEKLVILDAFKNDVTENYDIDMDETEFNFIERFVKIKPQTLVIDITKAVSTPYKKDYDGNNYKVMIVNTMVFQDVSSAGGFIGDLSQQQQLINKDEIRAESGFLITQDENVSRDENGVVMDKFLSVGKEIVIQNPDGVDVTNNYYVRYFKNIDEDIWNQIDMGYIDDANLPSVIISPREINLNISSTDKIQKYYDGEPLDLTFSYGNGQFNYSGTVINDNLSSLLTIGGLGLVAGEFAQFRIKTDDGIVGGQKQWTYMTDDFLITKNNINISYNYDIKTQARLAEILKRQICIDVNNGLDNIAEHIYDGGYYSIILNNDMVLSNSSNNKHLVDDTDSLGLIGNHTIGGDGTRISQKTDVGIQYLEMGNEIKIFNSNDTNVTKYYLINYTNDKVQIVPAKLVVKLPEENNGEIPLEKVYDGLLFTIYFSNNDIVTGLMSEEHYVSSGFLSTIDKKVGIDKQTICDTSLIKIMRRSAVVGEEEIDVTSNYYFEYEEASLTIVQKEITIKADAEFYKPYNDTTDIVLARKHYTFNANDICIGDTVFLTGYEAKFTSPEAGSAGEIIVVSELVINNNNYKLKNATFDITGHIVLLNPRVEVENNKQMYEKSGVEFVYDGLPKTAVYLITGLEGMTVQHSVTYKKVDLGEGEEQVIDNAPTHAGLYKMILTTQGIDENYPYWEGATIMIRINPAEIDISFTGSLNQTYGSVTNITAKATSSGGLNKSIIPTYTPINTSGGYAYPQAGEYQLIASYNENSSDPNYLPASKTTILKINKKNIEVLYGNIENLVYDGTIKNIAAEIKRGEILQSDATEVNNGSLTVSYSGDYINVRQAGNYTITVGINNNNYAIRNNTKNFVVLKKDLHIRTLINNSARLVINEGDKFEIIIEYDGFALGENRTYLSKPAYLPYVPQTTIVDFEVKPFGASSINYNFIYIPAYITIQEKKVSEITDRNNLAVVSGEYGSYVSLFAKSIETDITNPEYFTINEKIDKTFSSTDLLDNYKIQMAYQLSLSTDEDVASLPTIIKLKLSPSMKDMKSFVVLHFDSNGDYEIVGGYKEGDYVVFTAEPNGEFIIMVPQSGISSNLIILLFIAPIALFVVVILLFIMFRRKYDEG